VPDADGPYVVMVDENSHYMDESERYEQGRYPDCAAALAVCKHIVDEFLATSGGGATTAAELFRIYTLFGEDPFVVSTDPACDFSGWDYARQRCAEIFPR
jgi:hypothetical protein